MKQAALVFAALAAVLCVFQMAVALGAPLGHLTQGGMVDGALSSKGRMLAAGSALLTLAMAQIVLAHGELVQGFGPLGSRGALWVVVVVLLLTLAANLMTGSQAERLLWAPVALVMLVSALIVATRSTRA